MTRVVPALLCLLWACGGTSAVHNANEPAAATGTAEVEAEPAVSSLDLSSIPAPEPEPAPTAAALAPGAAPIELVADSRRALPHVPVAWHQHDGDKVFAVAGGARAVLSARGVEWAPALLGSGDVHAAQCSDTRWLFVINGVTVVVTDGFLGDPVATRELPREGDGIGGVVPDGVVVAAANWRDPMVISCDGEPVRDIAPSGHECVQAVELDGALGEAAPDLTEQREAIGQALARDLRVRSPWLWELHLRHLHRRTRVLPNGDRVWVLENPLRVFLYSGSSVRQLELPERERSSGASMEVFDWGEATGLLENDRVLYRLAPDGTVSLLAEGLRRQLDIVGHADSVWVTRGSCDGGRPSEVACWHGPGDTQRALGVDDQSISAEYADAETVLVRVRGTEDDPDEFRWLSTNGNDAGEPLVDPFGDRPIRRAADGTRWTTTMEREPELWVRWPGGDTAGEVLSLPGGTRVVGVASSEWVVAAGPSGVHVHAHGGDGWQRVNEGAFDQRGTFSMECTQLGCWVPDGRWVGRVPETMPSPIPGIDRPRPPHEVARSPTTRCESAGEPRAR
jgi:hypothetical protein